MNKPVNFASYTEGDEMIKMIIQNTIVQSPGNWVVYVKPRKPVLTKSEMEILVERRIDRLEQVLSGEKPFMKTREYEAGRQMIRKEEYAEMETAQELKIIALRKTEI